MTAFAAAVGTSHLASEAASEAAARARAQLGDATPVLAVAFASAAYDDLDGVPAAIEKELKNVPVIGGTAGGAVFAGGVVSTRAVLIALIGGNDVRATVVTAPISSRELFDVVPAGARLLSEAGDAARTGFEEPVCLAFAPADRVDGEAFVAALRKGTGARMQLAGALTGDDFTFDRARVFADGGAHADRVVLAGLFTERPIGIAARHGWRPAAPVRVVTSTAGRWLVRIDGRRAIDAWVADVRAAGGRPPSGAPELVHFLAHDWALGIEGASVASIEPPVRSPIALRDDGAVLLSSDVAEGARVHVMRAAADRIRDAGLGAGKLAWERAGGSPSGALIFASSAQLDAREERFREEHAVMARALGAPSAGACVFGEIARAPREVSAFHNTTTVVVALPH